jgi:hypothetical protein
VNHNLTLVHPSMYKTFVYKIRHMMLDIGNKYRCVNSGGCGVTAAILGTALQQYMPTRIVVCGHHDEERYGYWSQIKHDYWDGTFEGCSTGDIENGFSHVWTEFLLDKWYSIDTTACAETEVFAELTFYEHYYKDRCLVEDMQHFAAKDGNWSSMFSRGQMFAMSRDIMLGVERIMADVHVDVGYNAVHEEVA